jgi:hypothetical protein
MSDWSAQHSTMTGLDMTMPSDITFDSNTSYYGANLTAYYVENGTIPDARVDDMAAAYGDADPRIVIPPRPGLSKLPKDELERISPPGPGRGDERAY